MALMAVMRTAVTHLFTIAAMETAAAPTPRRAIAVDTHRRVTPMYRQNRR